MFRNSASGPKIGLPRRISDCYREDTEIGPSAGRRADFGAFPIAVRPKIWPAEPISGPEALLRNIG